MTDVYDKAYSRHAKKDTDECHLAMQSEFLATIAEEFIRFNERSEKEIAIIETAHGLPQQCSVEEVAQETGASVGRVIMVLSDYPGVFEITNGKVNKYL